MRRICSLAAPISAARLVVLDRPGVPTLDVRLGHGRVISDRSSTWSVAGSFSSAALMHRPQKWPSMPADRPTWNMAESTLVEVDAPPPVGVDVVVCSPLMGMSTSGRP